MLAAMSHRHKTFELWNYSQHEVFSHSSDYGLFKLFELFTIILFKHVQHPIWKIFSSGKALQSVFCVKHFDG